MLKRLCLFLVLGVAFCGCATQYQNSANPFVGWTGGYWDRKGPGKLTKVGFDGNGFIGTDKVGNYLLYRCAEVAKRDGAEYFVLYESLPDAISDRRSTRAHAASIGGKPSMYVYILLRDGPGTQHLSSTELITTLKPIVMPENTNKSTSKGTSKKSKKKSETKA